MASLTLNVPDWRRNAVAGTSLAAAKAAMPTETASSDVGIEFVRRARMSGMGQPQNLSTTLDVQRIQNALRSAERGDTWLLFTIFRDMVVGYAHLQAEWNKRKAVITGRPETLVPHDVNNADDVIACEVIRQMIDGCRNWFDGLNHLLDATLYPLAVCEKVYTPVELSEQVTYKHPIRFKLKELAPVPYELLCFKIPYMPSTSGNPALNYNPDEWEAWLRFYETFPGGAVNWATMNVYEPSPNIHVVHRGNMLSPTVPPNFGGHMRAILFWWLLATQDRDWWALMMQKYGSPFILGKADAQQKDTVQFLQAAFQLATQIGGLVIDKKAEAELVQANSSDGSHSHKLFNDYCNCEVSKIVLGQVLSSTPKNTGLGSGMADQAEEVREDLRQQDTMRLGDTLERQLFTDFLRVNGYRGRCHISWGGMREGAAQSFSKTLVNIRQAGLKLTDGGVLAASEKFGYGVENDPDFSVKPNNANGKPGKKDGDDDA